MRLVSVITSCFNEEDNVRLLYQQVRSEFEKLPDYAFEMIFIDNASQDGTAAILKEIAAADSRVKVILNARNFGHIRSPYHAFLQARGEAVICMVSDLQNPPALIPNFVHEWEKGNMVVMGVRSGSAEPRLVYALRRAYYRLLRRISDVELVENFTGFGLFDRRVVEIIRGLDDPYPYFRGIIADIGLPSAKVEFAQPRRRSGKTKNNFYTLFDMALLGMTSYSKLPLRLATLIGFAASALSLLVAVFYLVYKLLFWKSFALGLAPLVVGIFFFSSVQLFFLGIVGEYVGSIHTYVRKMPPVVERERINF